MNNWTPVELEVMLHCFYRPDSPGNSPAIRDAVAKLRRLEMIQVRTAEEDGWAATERGVVFVQALCQMPVPISVTRWEMPEQGEES